MTRSLLDSATFGLLRHTIAHREALSDALGALGLHLGQELTLAQLWKQDGRAQVDIAERAGVTAATASKVLRGLERKGLVRRARDDEDTRVVRVWLTEEGRALEHPVTTAWFQVERAAMNRLSATDREILARLSRRPGHGDAGTVDPAFAPVLRRVAAEPYPVVDDLAPAEARGAVHAWFARVLGIGGPPPPAPDSPVDTRDEDVDADDARVPIRIYTPRQPRSVRPVHVFFHGGGWWLGGIEPSDAYCRALAHEAGAIVVSAGYRLAPEHPYPVPLRDCLAVARWAASNAEALGGSPGRVSVGGMSAGGNLAAAVALAARDEGDPALCLQVVQTAPLDPALTSPSAQDFATGYLLTTDMMHTEWRRYLADAPADAYAAPLLAEDLHDLPPALVITADLDPVRDDGESYARRLAQSNVTVTSRRFAGTVHPFPTMPLPLPAITQARSLVAAAIAAGPTS